MKKPKATEREYWFNPNAIALKKKGLDAQAVGEEIERLRLLKGQHFEPAHLVEAARDNPANPCHGAFDWDVDSAATAHWVDQARYLVRNVKTRIITPERKEIVTRAFVSTSKDGAQQQKQYTSTEYALNDPILRAEVIRRALKELIAIKRMYAELTELADVFAAIDSTMKRVA